MKHGLPVERGNEQTVNYGNIRLISACDKVRSASTKGRHNQNKRGGLFAPLFVYATIRATSKQKALKRSPGLSNQV